MRRGAGFIGWLVVGLGGCFASRSTPPDADPSPPAGPDAAVSDASPGDGGLDPSDCPVDADGDGYVAAWCGGPDCDDADPGWFPSGRGVCPWRTSVVGHACEGGLRGEGGLECGAPSGTRLGAPPGGAPAWYEPASDTWWRPVLRPANERGWLESGPLDLSDWRLDPVLRFAWALSAEEVDADAVLVELSLDGGATWTAARTVQALVVEAFHREPAPPRAAGDAPPDRVYRVFDLRCDGAPWRTATVPLPGAGGARDVRVRFLPVGRGLGEGIAIDDVRLLERHVDVSFSGLHTPADDDAWRVSLANLGNVAVPAGDAELVIEGPAGRRTVPLPALPPSADLDDPGARVSVPFTGWPDAPPGPWAAELTLRYPPDEDPGNDGYRFGGFVPRTVTLGPGDVLEADFDDGSDGWGADPTGPWARGTPDGARLDGTASGEGGAWFTRLNPDGRQVRSWAPRALPDSRHALVLAGPRIVLSDDVQELHVQAVIETHLWVEDAWRRWFPFPAIDVAETPVVFSQDAGWASRRRARNVDPSGPRVVRADLSFGSDEVICGEGFAVDSVRIEAR